MDRHLLLGTPAARAIAAWLPRATVRTLDAADLARIDSYAGDGQALHEMLPAVLPLAAPVWYEAEVTAQRGTRMRLCYGATPAGPGQVDVWHAASAGDRLLVALGPLRIDSQSIDPHADVATPEIRELRAAAGIVVRALLLGCGSAVRADGSSP